MSIQTPGQTAEGGASRTNKLYFAVWRWHFYAGLFVIPFIVLLSVTGIIMVWFSAISPEYGERLHVTAGAEMPITAQAEAAAAHAGRTAGRPVRSPIPMTIATNAQIAAIASRRSVAKASGPRWMASDIAAYPARLGLSLA